MTDHLVIRGGAYRVNWYHDLKKDFYSDDMSIDLDIYRPLHKLWEIQGGGSLTPGLVSLSAGFHDVWGIDSNGNIMCQEIDGHPVNWKRITKNLSEVKKLAMGRFYTWALTTDNRVMKTELPLGWSANNCTDWIDVTSGHPMKDLDLNMSRVWAVDTDGKVFFRDLSAKRDWEVVPGELASITADDEFIWGFTNDQKIVRMSAQTMQKWDTIPNPFELTKIEAGATEIWGINDQDEVYRINSSGDGNWQLVTTGYNNMSVGYEQVWLSDDEGNMYHYALKGFESTTSFARDTTGLFPTAIDQLKSHELEVEAFPNPFGKSFRIMIQSDEFVKSEISLFDLNGHKLLSQIYAVKPGPNFFEMNNLFNFHQGIYILNVSTGDCIKRIKLVKQN